MSESQEHKFIFDLQGKDVFFKYECQKDSDLLSQQDILIALQSSPYASYKVRNQALGFFITQANKTIKNVQDEIVPPTQVKYLLAQAADATITIDVVEGNMKGIAKVEPAQGGRNLTAQDIKRYCIDEGIRFGLKSTLVQLLLDKTEKASPGTVIEQVIVLGRPVQNGRDAYIDPKVELFSDAIRNPKIMKDGRFDMRDLGSINTVTAGQVVAEKVEATAGLEGVDVLGNKIPPEPGKDIVLKATEGTEVSSDNPNQLIANKQGMLRRTEDEIVVDDVFILDKLTAREGHVKFDGSVIIKGDVASDMKIDAGGDVLIGGFVESSKVTTKGDLTILGGCSGRAVANEGIDEIGVKESSVEYSCELSAAGNIQVKFAAYSKLKSKQDIVADKLLTNCNVEAENIVVGKPDKPMGKIIGGSYYVSRTLGAGFIGNDSNVHTRISMNRAYDEFIRKESRIWRYVEQLEDKVTRAKRDITELVTPRDKLRLEKQIAIFLNSVENYARSRRIEMKKRKVFMKKVNIRVTRTMYPNVKIVIGDQAKRFSESKTASLIYVEDHEMVFEPLQ